MSQQSFENFLDEKIVRMDAIVALFARFKDTAYAQNFIHYFLDNRIECLQHVMQYMFSTEDSINTIIAFLEVVQRERDNKPPVVTLVRILKHLLQRNRSELLALGQPHDWNRYSMMHKTNK